VAIFIHSIRCLLKIFFQIFNVDSQRPIQLFCRQVRVKFSSAREIDNNYLIMQVIKASNVYIQLCVYCLNGGFEIYIGFLISAEPSYRMRLYMQLCCIYD
jgi:hypothetical protein